MENLWKASQGQSVQITHPQAYTPTYKYKVEGVNNIAIRPWKKEYKTSLRGLAGV